MRKASILIFIFCISCPHYYNGTGIYLLGAKSIVKYEGEVKLIFDDKPLPENYQEIAVLQDHWLSSEVPELLSRLQNKAASLGCNAIIRVKVTIHGTYASATGIAVILAPQVDVKATVQNSTLRGWLAFW
jgi:hypothetical protein